LRNNSSVIVITSTAAQQLYDLQTKLENSGPAARSVSLSLETFSQWSLFQEIGWSCWRMSLEV